LGGHDRFGEDGTLIYATESVGRADYGKPSCKGRRVCSYAFFNMFASKDRVLTNDIALVR